MNEVRVGVEAKHLTPLDEARVISSITATLFGYDEFILREFSAVAHPLSRVRSSFRRTLESTFGNPDRRRRQLWDTGVRTRQNQCERHE